MTHTRQAPPWKWELGFQSLPLQNHDACFRFLEPKAQVLRKSEAGLEVLPHAARFADPACGEGDEVTSSWCIQG